METRVFPRSLLIALFHYAAPTILFTFCCPSPQGTWSPTTLLPSLSFLGHRFRFFSAEESLHSVIARNTLCTDANEHVFTPLSSCHHHHHDNGNDNDGGGSCTTCPNALSPFPVSHFCGSGEGFFSPCPDAKGVEEMPNEMRGDASYSGSPPPPPPPPCSSGRKKGGNLDSGSNSSLSSFSSLSFSPSRYVCYHTRLLSSILSSSSSTDTLHRKQRRVMGIIQKLEKDAPAWLLPSLERRKECSGERKEQLGLKGEEVVELLSAMASAKNLFLGTKKYGSFGRGGGSGGGGGGSLWPPSPSGESCFASPAFQDFISLCVGVGATCADSSSSSHHDHHHHHQPLLSLLSAAITLEASGAPLEELCRFVTTAEFLRRLSSPAMRCATFHLVSLAVKRCGVLPPSLLSLFSSLAEVPRWEHEEVLFILSAFVRVHSSFDMEVACRVSHLGIAHVPQYTVKDLVFALTAMAYLKKIDERYAGEVLQRCVEILPQTSPREVGDISKYMALLNANRARLGSNRIAASAFCAPLIRRVVYTIADRSGKLLGKFSIREAKYVLRCLKQHDVRHGLVFASLVPVAFTSE